MTGSDLWGLPTLGVTRKVHGLHLVGKYIRLRYDWDFLGEVAKFTTSILGLRSNLLFHSFHLSTVIYNSDLEIVVSITRKWKRLGSVGLFLVMIIFWFGMSGLLY